LFFGGCVPRLVHKTVKRNLIHSLNALKKWKIKLGDGKEREIQHTMQTSFRSADGKPISEKKFLHNLFGKLPEFFKDEAELRKYGQIL